MLAGLWWQHKDSRAEGERLPRTEADLYRQALEHLLTRWTRKPGNTQSVEEELGLNTGQLRLALQIVALQTQRESEVGEDTTLFHKERLQLALLRVDEDGRPKPSIDYLQAKAGVLLSPHTDYFRFAHRSFQEHLAACELLGEQEQPPLIAPLAELVIESPALWRNVLQHACDELIRRDEREKLWELIRALTDPWLANAEQDKMVQPALLALQNAERQSLLKSARDRRDPHRADLEDLQQIALALIVDLRLVAKERASAGRCLAKLGDPRQGVMDVRAMEWLPVNAGPFQMGSADTDELAWDAEKPLHTQHIEQAYKIARFPITNAQYWQFVDAGGYDNAVYWPQAGEYWQPKLGYKGRYDDDYRKAPAYAADELDRFGLDNQPVVRISWHEAVAFTRWLTAFLRRDKKIGEHEGIRLPSESEWEKACRGDRDARVTPWDGPPDPERSNYDDSGIDATSAVGCFPNGITGCEGEDMIGNVREWTTTKWVDSYTNYGEAEDNAIDTSENSRVLRGGSWLFDHGDARCASRFGSYPDSVSRIFGLRCVLSPSSLKR